MANLLTDRQFWVNYWEGKTNLATTIPKDYLFHKQLRGIIEKHGVNTAIELGGFPGYYAVFLKRYFNLDVTLLDYFVHQPVTNSLLKANGLAEGDIQIVETDLFSYHPETRYDLVLSCGLIEHFVDTRDIIDRHIQFMKPGGSLFITLPNFNALNGWFQKKFDRENYNKHNIDCMDPDFLRKICEDAGLKVIRAEYFGKFSLWLESEDQKPAAVRLLRKAVWLAGKLFTKVVPFNSRQLSPYIIIEAKK